MTESLRPGTSTSLTRSLSAGERQRGFGRLLVPLWQLNSKPGTPRQGTSFTVRGQHPQMYGSVR